MQAPSGKGQVASAADPTELRCWAVERVIAAGLHKEASMIVSQAAMLVGFVEGAAEGLRTCQIRGNGTPAQIWELSLTGMWPRDIARRLGISAASVNAMLCRERRAHGIPPRSGFQGRPLNGHTPAATS